MPKILQQKFDKRVLKSDPLWSNPKYAHLFLEIEWILKSSYNKNAGYKHFFLPMRYHPYQNRGFEIDVVLKFNKIIC